MTRNIFFFLFFQDMSESKDVAAKVAALAVASAAAYFIYSMAVTPGKRNRVVRRSLLYWKCFLSVKMLS